MYIGQCDKIRKTEKGEIFWKNAMEHKTPISESKFIRAVGRGIRSILDDGETWADYKASTSDKILFYVHGNVYFFQTCGFEFFWKIQ